MAHLSKPSNKQEERSEMSTITVVTDAVRQRMVDELTIPGGPFEVGDESIGGVTYKVFKTCPRNLKAVYDRGIEKNSFFAKTIIGWFGDQDLPFIVYRKERYTFSEVYRRAASLASWLKNRYGIVKGDRVAIAMRNYPEFCLIFMAATAIGAVVVPLNAWWEGPELEYGLKDSEPRLIFVDQQRAYRLMPYFKQLRMPLIVARPEGKLPDDVMDFEDVSDGMSADEFPPAVVNPDDDAYIMYTSGSTGKPRGVVTTHRAVITTLISWQFPVAGLLHLNKDYLAEIKPRYQPATCLTLPLFHVTGLTQFLCCFVLKRKMVMMYKWNPEEALTLIERERISHFTGVPSMSWEMCNLPNLKKYDLSSLTVLNSGGAARPPRHVKDLEKILGRHITQTGYGLTETAAIGAINEGENYAIRPDSLGKPTPPLVEAKIVDERGKALGNGDIGEICFKSPANMRCYWNDRRATKEIMLDGGWVKTGDVGIIDKEGFIYIKDRAKDLVIRGGENIACQEVEDAINEHPSVFEAAVFGLPEPKLGEQVAAVVMIRQGASLNQQSLKDFLKSRLAAFKIPGLIWIQTEPLMRGATGKLYKKGIREGKLKEIITGD